MFYFKVKRLCAGDRIFGYNGEVTGGMTNYITSNFIILCSSSNIIRKIILSRLS
jgi:hypothetical protein